MTRLHPPHAIEVKLHVREINVAFLAPETADIVGVLSSSISLSVEFSIQDEAMDVSRPAPQVAHYHADVIYLLPKLGTQLSLAPDKQLNPDSQHTFAFYTKCVSLVRRPLWLGLADLGWILPTRLVSGGALSNIIIVSVKIIRTSELLALFLNKNRNEKNVAILLFLFFKNFHFCCFIDFA